MLKFIIRRIIGVVPVLWVLATLTFFFVRIAPGGPFDGDKLIPPEILKNIQAKYHLDKPLLEQYVIYMGDLLRGDLGPSFRYASLTVNEIIASTLPVSAKLGGLAMLYALLLGCLSGMLAASKPNSLRDYVPMGFSLLGVCMPSFVIGPLLVLVFAVHLGWFNTSGWNDLPKDMVLPALTLGTMYAAYFSRLVRVGFLDIMNQDFIRTAKAKGVGTLDIFLRHASKGGVLPATSFCGLAMVGMVSGSIVVEMIFDIPGLGRFFVQSALNRDYTLIIGTALFYVTALLLMNLLVDIAYVFLNPRVRYD